MLTVKILQIKADCLLWKSMVCKNEYFIFGLRCTKAKHIVSIIVIRVMELREDECLPVNDPVHGGHWAPGAVCVREEGGDTADRNRRPRREQLLWPPMTPHGPVLGQHTESFMSLHPLWVRFSRRWLYSFCTTNE